MSARDPFPQSKREQIEALNRLLGTAVETPPVQFGSSLHFQVSWTRELTKRRRAKLPAEELDAYDTGCAEAQRYVGVHRRDFVPPFEHWTAADVDSLVSDMGATLQAIPARPDVGAYGDGRWFVNYYRYSRRIQNHDGVSIRVGGGNRDFVADTYLPVHVSTNAIVEWLVRLDPYKLDLDMRGKGVVLHAISHRPQSMFDQPWRTKVAQ